MKLDRETKNSKLIDVGNTVIAIMAKGRDARRIALQSEIAVEDKSRVLHSGAKFSFWPLTKERDQAAKYHPVRENLGKRQSGYQVSHSRFD